MNPKATKVLVVDDEPDMCWAMKNILGPAGYSVTTTMGATGALELLASASYDVAFVDAMLPDGDGFELAATIRQRWPETAVILISGYHYPEDAVITEGMQRGLFVDLVAKPFDIEKIRTIVHELVQGDGEHGRRGADPSGR